jgi:hypothetical protein
MDHRIWIIHESLYQYQSFIRSQMINNSSSKLQIVDHLNLKWSTIQFQLINHSISLIQYQWISHNTTWMNSHELTMIDLSFVCQDCRSDSWTWVSKRSLPPEPTLLFRITSRVRRWKQLSPRIRCTWLIPERSTCESRVVLLFRPRASRREYWLVSTTTLLTSSFQGRHDGHHEDGSLRDAHCVWKGGFHSRVEGPHWHGGGRVSD